MTRNEHGRLEARDLAARLVSCPDCGTLCYRYRGVDWDGQIFDLNPEFVPWRWMPDWFEAAVIRQGVGVNRGGLHRCPPTRVPLEMEAAS